MLYDDIMQSCDIVLGIVKTQASRATVILFNSALGLTSTDERTVAATAVTLAVGKAGMRATCDTFGIIKRCRFDRIKIQPAKSMGTETLTLKVG